MWDLVACYRFIQRTVWWVGLFFTLASESDVLVVLQCIAADFQPSRAYPTRVLWLSFKSLVKSNIEFYVPSWNRFSVVLNATDVASDAVIILKTKSCYSPPEKYRPSPIAHYRYARCTPRCQCLIIIKSHRVGAWNLQLISTLPFFAGILTTFSCSEPNGNSNISSFHLSLLQSVWRTLWFILGIELDLLL